MDVSKNQSSSEDDASTVPSSDINISTQQGPIGITPQTPKDEEVLKTAIIKGSSTNHAASYCSTNAASAGSAAANEHLDTSESAVENVQAEKSSTRDRNSINVSPNEKEGFLSASLEQVDLEYSLGPLDPQVTRPIKRKRLHHDAQVERPIRFTGKSDAAGESVPDALANKDNVPTRSFDVPNHSSDENSSPFVETQSSTKISSAEPIPKISDPQKRNVNEAGELTNGLNEDEIETPRAGASPSKFQPPKVRTAQNRTDQFSGLNFDDFTSMQSNDNHGQLDVKSDISSASSLVESYHEDEESRPFPPAPPSTPATAKDVYQPLLVQLNSTAGSLEYTMGLKGENEQPTISSIAATPKGPPLMPEDSFGDDVATPLPRSMSYSAAIAETPRGESDGDVTPDIEGCVTERRQNQEHKRSKIKPATMTDFDLWDVGERYELKRMLGKGSYGEVAQAIDRHAVSLQEKTTNPPENQESESKSKLPLYYRNSTSVAVKRISKAFDQEVDAVRLFREMHILRRLRGHECIIQLVDVVQPRSADLSLFNDLYLVFEYVDTDLYKLIMSPQYLTTEHIQTFLYQMLVGIKYIHSSSGKQFELPLSKSAILIDIVITVFTLQ